MNIINDEFVVDARNGGNLSRYRHYVQYPLIYTSSVNNIQFNLTLGRGTGGAENGS